MFKNYRFIGCCVLKVIALTALSMAERPLVLTGYQSVEATVQSLLASDIQAHFHAVHPESYKLLLETRALRDAAGCQ